MAGKWPFGSGGHGIPGGWPPGDAKQPGCRSVAGAKTRTDGSPASVAGAAAAADGRKAHGASMPAGTADAAAPRHAGEAAPAGEVAAACVEASFDRELAALKPPARVSRVEALVRDHEGQIRKKLAEGVTAKAICALLAGHDAPLSPRHLRRILRKLDDRRAAGERGGASGCAGGAGPDAASRADGGQQAEASAAPGSSPAEGSAARDAAAGGDRPRSPGPGEGVDRDVRPRPADRQPDLFDEADDDAEEPW